jgi:hypothetical protein
MFANFFPGPIHVTDSKEGAFNEMRRFQDQNWIPVLLLTRGELVDHLRTSAPPQFKEAVKFVIVTMSYKEPYYDNK